MDIEEQKAFNKFIADEQLNSDKVKSLIEDYLFTQRAPTRNEVIEALESQPSVLNRKSIGEKLLVKFGVFVDTFFGE